MRATHIQVMPDYWYWARAIDDGGLPPRRGICPSSVSRQYSAMAPTQRPPRFLTRFAGSPFLLHHSALAEQWMPSSVVLPVPGRGVAYRRCSQKADVHILNC